MMENWLPTIISGGALTLVWLGIRTQRKEVKDEINRVDAEGLKKVEHSLMCENVSLKINKHLTSELIGLKDSLFVKLREIENTIKNGGK